MMRLLNTRTLELKEFSSRSIPPYVILSHTWGAQEVLYEDIINRTARKKAGFNKIKGCCVKAIADGFQWVWIDTCCIDKSSSAELSETINSMFEWYKRSAICYAYLEDVCAREARLTFQRGHLDFGTSRWFTRGWTLQELIAPTVVEFYTTDWVEIGTKGSLKSKLSKITGIPEAVLLGHRDPSSCTIAQRMSWASNRQTTRTEDIAYSLLGLFEINMPMLYGEGTRAFVRLQEEIIQREEDYTIFLWSAQYDCSGLLDGVFAKSPADFSITLPPELQIPSGSTADFYFLRSRLNLAKLKVTECKDRVDAIHTRLAEEELRINDKVVALGVIHQEIVELREERARLLKKPTWLKDKKVTRRVTVLDAKIEECLSTVAELNEHSSELHISQKDLKTQEESLQKELDNLIEEQRVRQKDVDQSTKASEADLIFTLNHEMIYTKDYGQIRSNVINTSDFKLAENPDTNQKTMFRGVTGPAHNPPQMTSRGLRIQLPVKQLTISGMPLVACINCSIEDKLLCIFLQSVQNNMESFARYQASWLCAVNKDQMKDFIITDLYLLPSGTIVVDENESARANRKLGRLRISYRPGADEYDLSILSVTPSRNWNLDELFYQGEPDLVACLVFQNNDFYDGMEFVVNVGYQNGIPWCKTKVKLPALEGDIEWNECSADEIERISNLAPSKSKTQRQFSDRSAVVFHNQTTVFCAMLRNSIGSANTVQQVVEVSLHPRKEASLWEVMLFGRSEG